MTTSKSYWYYTLLTIVLSVGFFLLFKNLLPNKLFSEVVVDSEHLAVDEWMQKALEEEQSQAVDTTALKTAFEIISGIQEEDKTLEDSLSKPLEEPLLALEYEVNPIEDKLYLNHFYKSLLEVHKAPNSKKVRIAYFGDSMTDGDWIVQDLRELLQKKYGGAGVGFVPVTSESASARGSITHKFSKNWKEFSFIKSYDSIFPFGVNGEVFYQADTVNPTYLQFSSGIYNKNKNLQTPELYYSYSTNKNAKLRVATSVDTVEHRLQPDQRINKLILSNNNLRSINLEFIDADSIPIYGVNFDTPHGIQVDNFSKRGNSGLPITQLDIQLMRAFQSSLGYDLIILHYGTNVLSGKSFNYGWYQSRMERVVDHLRNAFPQTSILVVSIADKATKYDTEMQTDSAVTHLLSAQRAYAAKKKTGFVDLFHLMGGEGSMVTWVEEEPERANKDYTHFNHRGSKEIAKMIYDQIETGFEEYQIKLKRIEAEKEKQRIQDSIKKAEAEKLRLLEIEEALRLKQDSIYGTEI